MNNVKIVGMDPSLSNFGIAQATLDLDTMKFTVDKLTLVCTENEKDKKIKKAVRKNSEDLERAKILHAGLLAACEGHWLAVAEVPVGSQSSRAMASYGVCIGVLAACPMPLIQVTPTEVKMAGFGNKTATKQEMIEWAMAKYPDANWIMRKSGGVMVPTNANEHLADAVAALEAGIRTDQFKQIVAMYKSMNVRLAA
jgi:Holliday junction resolvasome RuvABC endonuclease subunit